MDCGTPKNGMFIAVAEEIKELVTDISPNHWRIQAVILQTVNNIILIINSYFPTDSKIADFDESELLTTLSTIESVLDENEYDDVVWAGDINAEFSRNTHYTNVIQSFVVEKSLLKCWDKWPIDFSHELSGHSYTSIRDHFFRSSF